MIRKPPNMPPEHALRLIAEALATLNRVRKGNGAEPLTRAAFSELEGTIAEDGAVTVRDETVSYSITHGVVTAKPGSKGWPTRPLLTGTAPPVNRKA